MICGRSSGSGGHLAVLSHNRKLAHPHFSIPIFLLTGLTLRITILFRDMFGGSHRLPFLFLVLIREAMLHRPGAIVNCLESTLTQWPTNFDFNQLTENLNYLESTLTKNKGGGGAVG
jgi:hypothetical protein